MIKKVDWKFWYEKVILKYKVVYFVIGVVN